MEKELTKEIKENAEKILEISFEDYVEACKEFAQDTKEWLDLRFGTAYCTGHGGEDSHYSAYWYASNDCNQGGLLLNWAFHKTCEEIDEYAPSHYLDAYEWALDLIENP